MADSLTECRQCNWNTGQNRADVWKNFKNAHKNRKQKRVIDSKREKPGEWHSGDGFIHLDAEETLTLVNEHLNPYVEDRVMEDLQIPS